MRVAFSSTAMTELNGSPVALTPSRARASSGPSAWQTSANAKGFDTLWIEKRCSWSPTPKALPAMPTIAMPNRSRRARASAGM